MAQPTDKLTTPITAHLETTIGDVALLLDRGRDGAVAPPVLNPDGSVTHFVGKDVRPVTVQALNVALPDHVVQSEVMVEPDSFADYVIRFKSSTAVCRASLGQRQLEAVLDYHGQARSGDSDAAVPGRGRHLVTLRCAYDDDYAKWRKVLGGYLGQQEMIEFVEDMIHTIAEPAAADLLEAFADVEIERAVKFKSKRNDKNGNVTFTYEEVDGETKRVGSFTMPDHVSIVVPIFQGGVAIQLVAKVRVRMEKGDLQLGLAVAGLAVLEREAFRSIGEAVRETTATPVFYTA